MKIIYLAHPIGGNVEENLRCIRELVRNINMELDDVVPLVPYYADVVSLNDHIASQRQRGIRNSTEVLCRGMVDELWLYGNRISKGMVNEILIAKEVGIPIVPRSLCCIHEYRKLDI